MKHSITPVLGLAAVTLLIACSGGTNVEYADQGVDEALIEPPSSLVAEDLQPETSPTSSAEQGAPGIDCVPADSSATVESSQPICKE